MKQWTTGLLIFVASLAIAGAAFAQGGGASSTGTIQGASSTRRTRRCRA